MKSPRGLTALSVVFLTLCAILLSVTMADNNLGLYTTNAVMPYPTPHPINGGVRGALTFYARIVTKDGTTKTNKPTQLTASIIIPNTCTFTTPVASLPAKLSAAQIAYKTNDQREYWELPLTTTAAFLPLIPGKDKIWSVTFPNAFPTDEWPDNWNYHVTLTVELSSVVGAGLSCSTTPPEPIVVEMISRTATGQTLAREAWAPQYLKPLVMRDAGFDGVYGHSFATSDGVITTTIRLPPLSHEALNAVTLDSKLLIIGSPVLSEGLTEPGILRGVQSCNLYQEVLTTPRTLADVADSDNYFNRTSVNVITLRDFFPITPAGQEVDWLSIIGLDKGVSLTCKYVPKFLSTSVPAVRNFNRYLDVSYAHSGVHIAIVPGDATDWTPANMTRKDDLFITEAIHMATTAPLVVNGKLDLITPVSAYPRLSPLMQSEAIATRWERRANDDYFYHSNWTIHIPYTDPKFNTKDYSFVTPYLWDYGFELTAEGIHVWNENATHTVLLQCTPDYVNFTRLYPLGAGILVPAGPTRPAPNSYSETRIPVARSYNHTLTGLTTQGMMAASFESFGKDFIPGTPGSAESAAACANLVITLNVAFKTNTPPPTPEQVANLPPPAVTVAFGSTQFPDVAAIDTVHYFRFGTTYPKVFTTNPTPTPTPEPEPNPDPTPLPPPHPTPNTQDVAVLSELNPTTGAVTASVVIVNTTRFIVPSGAVELNIHPHYQFEIRKTKIAADVDMKKKNVVEEEEEEHFMGQQIPVLINRLYTQASLDSTNVITVQKANLPLIPGNVVIELPTIDIYKKKTAPDGVDAPIFTVLVPEWQVFYRQYIKEPTTPLY